MGWRWAVAFAGISVGLVGCLGAPPELPGVIGSSGSTSEASTSGPGSTSDVDTGPIADDGSSDGNDTDPFGSVCGDGIIEGDEECDLGPANGSGDYCTSSCTTNVCGDGYLGPGEACDDGNTNNGDQCTSECGLATCGDGNVQAGEECDEGDANSVTGACLPSCLEATCGDLFIHEGVETCDGVNTGAETCQSQGFDGGVLECRGDCSAFDTSNCHECGNGMIEPTEQCDGMDFGGLSCADYAPMGTTPSGGALGCSGCIIHPGDCTFCGDDVVEGTEQCDGSDLGGNTCSGVLGMGYDGNLGCSVDCSLDASDCCLTVGASCMNDADCCSGGCGMGACLGMPM